MKNIVRPLTKTMIDKLQYCRNIEMNGSSPCLPEDIKYSLAPLYKRGYIGLKRVVVNNKEIIAVFVTPSGINCLEYLHQIKHKSVA